MRIAFLVLAACAHAPASAVIVPGQVSPNKGPDGNSILLDAPGGLIVIDTGRHPEHAQQVLDVARRRGKPIAAILNTHWHLDHTTGNKDLRQAFPHAEVYATLAIDGALQTYLQHGRAQVDAMLADPATPEAQRAELLRGRDVIDHPAWLRPTCGSSIRRRATRTSAISSSRSCRSSTPRARAGGRRRSYGNLLACAASTAPDADCIAGWQRDAAPFITDATYVKEALGYYLHERLRSPEATARYCAPLRAPDPTAPR